MTEAQPKSLYASRGFYSVKKPIAHILTNTKMIRRGYYKSLRLLIPIDTD